jgi:hypothetical protein
MEQREFSHITVAVIILALVASFSSLLNKSYSAIPWIFLFSVIIIFINILAKKYIANYLDADVEHEIWQWSRYGIKNKQKLSKSLPAGVILPLLISLFSTGSLLFLSILTYEPRALKRRAAKRHGFYSFTEMTDTHNAIIGATGIFSLLILGTVVYFLPFQLSESLAKLAIYYAFWNVLPISKFDGTQIYFGSPVLYSITATITFILAAIALITI